MGWRDRGQNGYNGLVTGGIRETEDALHGIYQEAYNGLSGTIKGYFEAFAEKDSAMYKKWADGEITRGQYYQWRKQAMATGQRYEELRDNVAQRILGVNKQAAAFVNNDSAEMYALGHDYTAFTIERSVSPAAGPGDAGARINFNLVPERAVREAVNGGNHVNFRVLSVDPVRDYKWNERRITQIVASGLEQGKSVQKIARDFMTVMENNEKAAIRNARTALTSAAGAGCQSAADEAAEMGLTVKKEWIAANDDRTRDSHAELNGVQVGVDEEFPNGLMYPGDPSGAPGEVYNCRCTMKTVVAGLTRARASADNNAQSYMQWRQAKEQQQ